MGRPAMKTGQRIRKIDTRFTEEEFNALIELERTSGMSRSELIRIRVLENQAGFVVNVKEMMMRLDLLGAQLGRIGNNMNQLARYANTLNKRGVLSPQIVERYNQILGEYVAAQLFLDSILRKVVRKLSR